MIFYTKFVFAVIWTLLYTTLLIPFLILTFWDKNNFRRWTHGIAWGVIRITGLKPIMNHSERLTQQAPCIFMGNHQSAYDVVTYGKYTPPRTTAVGKREIALIPIVGWSFALAGGILLNRKHAREAIGQLSALAKHMRDNKISVGILPEGTRNRHPETLLPFKKGPFHLAVQTGAWIVPLVCEPFSHRLNVKERKVTPGIIRMEALEPISTQGMDESDIPALMAEVQDKMQRTINSFSGDS